MLMKNVLNMNVHLKGGEWYPVEMEVKRIGCSRNASRDVESTERQLEEIRAKGYQVHGPAGICFRSRYLVTNEGTIEVQGPQTSGEVEFVAMRHGRNTYVSVGSDHNDRSLENLWTAMLGRIYDTAKSKQMVPAVVARDAWLYDEVKDHWDELVLRSFVSISKQKVPYQEFKLDRLLDLEYYLTQAPWISEEGSLLLGGSGGILSCVPENVYHGQSTLEDVVFPGDFHFEMLDPVLSRTIRHHYTVISLEEPESCSL